MIIWRKNPRCWSPGWKVIAGNVIVIVVLLIQLQTEEANAQSESLNWEAFHNEVLMNPDRPASDREQDVSRKPFETLTLAGIKPGMQIADLMAGKGWYTEILARAVGPDGTVLSLNNSVSNRPHGEDLRRRIKDSNLRNVVPIVRELEDPGLPEAKLDAVFMVQFYHDTYWMGVDRETMNARIYDSLKPGGVYCVIDHASAEGAGETVTRKLHRVEPSLVLSEIVKAGFVLENTSDLLRNNEDDRGLNVFDPAVRGHTDQFLFIFRKPL